MYHKGRSVHTMSSSEKNYVINNLVKIIKSNPQANSELLNFTLDTGLLVKDILVNEDKQIKTHIK